jgi:hypothetical protein
MRISFRAPGEHVASCSQRQVRAQEHSQSSRKDLVRSTTDTPCLFGLHLIFVIVVLITNYLAVVRSICGIADLLGARRLRIVKSFL